MNAKSIWLWCLANALSVFVFAQQTTDKVLVGVITDSLAAAVPFALLTTHQKDSAAILTFCTADVEGNFNIIAPHFQEVQLKIAALGFETKTISLSPAMLQKKLTIVLSAKVMQLEEAVITATNSIIARSDTTTFHADNFRDSTEHNLEQLLVKMPGVEVNKETGQIMVQGKEIKKILIDGDDLTGRNYTLLSQNMPADLVDKIQIIERFQENRLLKGLKKSNATVINVTIKENKNSVWVGTADLGVGTAWKNDHDVNVLSFSKRFKNMNVGKFNNVGIRSSLSQTNDEVFDVTDETTEGQKMLFDNTPSRFLDSDYSPAVSFGSRNIQFNQSLLGSSHLLIRPRETYNIKCQFSLSQDRVQYFTQQNTQYLLVDTTLQLNQFDSIRIRPFFVDAKLEAQWDISEKSIIRVKSQLRKALQNSNIASALNQQTVTNTMRDDALTKQLSIDYTNRLAENKALSFNVWWFDNYNQQQFRVRQNYWRNTPSVLLTNMNSAFRSTSQSVENPMQYLLNTAQLYITTQNTNINISSGYIYKKEKLTGNLSLDDVALPDSLSNKSHYLQENIFLGVNAQTILGRARIFANALTGYYHLQQQNHHKDPLERRTKRTFYAFPTLGLHWSKHKNNLFFTYSYNTALPSFTDLHTAYMLKSLRNLEIGSNNFFNNNAHTFIFNYNYGKIQDVFMCQNNLIFSRQQGGYRTDAVINQDFDITSKTQNTLPQQSFRWSSGFEYYSAATFMRFKIKPYINIFQYQNILNGEAMRRSTSLQNGLHLTVRSAYLKGFNFSLGGNVGNTNITTKALDEKQHNTSKTFGAYLDFMFRIQDKVHIRWDNEMFAYQQATGQLQKYYFSNISVDVKWKQWADITIEIQNLMNTKSLRNNMVTDYITSTSSMKLQPRYLMVYTRIAF